MENIFEDAKFGDRYRLRDGRMAVYLSTYYGGSEDDKHNPPFVDVEFAVEVHIKYTDGSEKRFHRIDRYDGATGKFNKWATEDCDWDIVGKWEESVDEDRLNKLADDYVEGKWDAESMQSRIDFKNGYFKAKKED